MIIGNSFLPVSLLIMSWELDLFISTFISSIVLLLLFWKWISEQIPKSAYCITYVTYTMYNITQYLKILLEWNIVSCNSKTCYNFSRSFLIEHVFLYDKENLGLFKSFCALNKTSYQDGDYWKQIFKFLHFLRPYSNLIYTKFLI